MHINAGLATENALVLDIQNMQAAVPLVLLFHSEEM